MPPFKHPVIVEWSAEDAVYVARVPSLAPDWIVAAHGDTPEEALRTVIEVVHALPVPPAA